MEHNKILITTRAAGFNATYTPCFLTEHIPVLALVGFLMTGTFIH